jgi:hypothetical protein
MEDDLPTRPTATRAKRPRFDAAGHSRKLIPIINSLSSLETEDEPWSAVKRRVKELEDTFEMALNDSPEHAAAHLETLMAAARAALAEQSELFASHRNVCVAALSLRLSV